MTCNLSNSRQIDAVFLDLEKAFDKVPHQRLLLRLEYYGIRSKTLQWIGNFFNNRKQCVNVEGEWLLLLLLARLINRQDVVFDE